MHSGNLPRPLLPRERPPPEEAHGACERTFGAWGGAAAVDLCSSAAVTGGPVSAESPWLLHLLDQSVGPDYEP